MFLVDTSVWIDLLRDQTDLKRATLALALGDDDFALSRIQQLELLQGCRDEREWTVVRSYLDEQDYLELTAESWSEAARIYFDLRRQGKTVRSALDCCIAQVAIDHEATLLHRDRDFIEIASIRPLRQLWLDW